jgi:hypothetical protein
MSATVIQNFNKRFAMLVRILSLRNMESMCNTLRILFLDTSAQMKHHAVVRSPAISGPCQEQNDFGHCNIGSGGGGSVGGRRSLKEWR